MIDFKAFADEVVKIAGAKSAIIKAITKRPVAALGTAALGGAGAYHGGKQAIQDWKMGRTIRRQSRR